MYNLSMNLTSSSLPWGEGEQTASPQHVFEEDEFDMGVEVWTRAHGGGGRREDESVCSDNTIK